MYLYRRRIIVFIGFFEAIGTSEVTSSDGNCDSDGIRNMFPPGKTTHIMFDKEEYFPSVYSLIEKSFIKAENRQKCMRIATHAYNLYSGNLRQLHRKTNDIRRKTAECEIQLKIEETKLGLRGYLQDILDDLVPDWLNDLRLSRKLRVEISVQMQLGFYGKRIYSMLMNSKEPTLDIPTFAKNFAKLYDDSHGIFHRSELPALTDFEWPIVKKALQLDSTRANCLHILLDMYNKEPPEKVTKDESNKKEYDYLTIDNMPGSCKRSDVQAILSTIPIPLSNYMYGSTKTNENFLIIKCEDAETLKSKLEAELGQLSIDVNKLNICTHPAFKKA